MNPLIRPWRHLFDFRGRATRTEYLLYHVTGFVALMLIGILIGVVAALVNRGGQPASKTADLAITVILLLGYLVFFITHIAIGVRRLHDHGEPGAKYLLTFIPLVGLIFWCMMIFTRGDDFENDYGHDPRLGERATSDQLGGVFS